MIPCVFHHGEKLLQHCQLKHGRVRVAKVALKEVYRLLIWVEDPIGELIVVENVGFHIVADVLGQLDDGIWGLARDEHVLEEVGLGEIVRQDCQNVDDLFFDDLISKVHKALGQNKLALLLSYCK